MALGGFKEFPFRDGSRFCNLTAIIARGPEPLCRSKAKPAREQNNGNHWKYGILKEPGCLTGPQCLRSDATRW